MASPTISPAESDQIAEIRPWSRMTPVVRTAAVMDRSTIAAMRRFLKQPSPIELERIDAELIAAELLFEREGWIADPEAYHLDPAPLTDPRIRGVRGRLPFEWVTWESGYEPHPGEPGLHRWSSYRENRIARAAVFRHDGPPRPWIVCVHGFGMGRTGLDVGAFRVGRLFHRLGLNVALPVLPLHATRRSPLLSRFAGYPSADVVNTMHAAAQATFDIRRLLDWIRGTGAPSVGIQGMSLGGYTTALVASLESDLAFAGLLIPAADLGVLIADNADSFAASAGDLGRSVIERTERVMQVVSPLAMTPKVPHERRYVVAGTVDGLARPSRHAIPLWEHWDRPAMKWYHGAHVSVFWTPGIGTFLDERWTEAGVIPVD